MVSMIFMLFFNMGQNFCADNNIIEWRAPLLPSKENFHLITSVRESIFQQDIKAIKKQLQNMQKTDISFERLEGFLLLSQYQRSQITDSATLTCCFPPLIGFITFTSSLTLLVFSREPAFISVLDFLIPTLGALAGVYIGHLHDSNRAKQISESIIQEFQEKLLEYRRLSEHSRT